MELIQFKPETIGVSVGEPITWIQRDPGFHTVTSGLVEQGAGGVTPKPDGRFNSGELETNKEFTFTFYQTGIFPYFCSIHPATMRGEVRVVQAG
jgi:plastocyanin